MDFATRGENTLDLVYTNIKDEFRAAPCPHLGSSDHLSVMLIPAYRPLLIRAKPTVRQILGWDHQCLAPELHMQETILGCMAEWHKRSGITQATGGRFNLAKSTLLCCGTAASPSQLPTVQTIDGPFRFLGVYLGEDENHPEERSWGTVTEKVKTTFNLWRMRGLGHRGRAVVANSLALTLVYHTLHIHVLPRSGGVGLSPMALLKATKEVCGTVLACRMITKDKFEMTVLSQAAKDRLLGGDGHGPVAETAPSLTASSLLDSAEIPSAQVPVREGAEEIVPCVPTTQGTGTGQSLTSKVMVAGAEPGRGMSVVIAPHSAPEAEGMAPPQGQIPKQGSASEANRGREPVRGAANREKPRSQSLRDRSAQDKRAAEPVPTEQAGAFAERSQASLIPGPRRPVSAGSCKPATIRADGTEHLMDFSTDQDMGHMGEGVSLNACGLRSGVRMHSGILNTTWDVLCIQETGWEAEQVRRVEAMRVMNCTAPWAQAGRSGYFVPRQR
ncbi:unnamed protein product [Menidia menidia]|uniref:(Atlantic silverside) hypothetical protein n=1 Tax=Menidia menidia TaxID=238744 RepID=A0A8S4C3A4_9TELE|nr:unnamed protein product [Menidia menidia]